MVKFAFRATGSIARDSIGDGHQGDGWGEIIVLPESRPLRQFMNGEDFDPEHFDPAEVRFNDPDKRWAVAFDDEKLTPDLRMWEFFMGMAQRRADAPWLGCAVGADQLAEAVALWSRARGGRRQSEEARRMGPNGPRVIRLRSEADAGTSLASSLSRRSLA